MYWAIGYILENYLQGRKITVLGNGYNALKWSTEIKRYSDTLLNINSINKLNKKKYYLIICEDIYNDHTIELKKNNYIEIKDYYDWTKYARTNGHLPVDVIYNKTSIGYGSYFSFPKDNFKHITTIGRFCSISKTAVIQGNHSMNRITTSSLYPMLTKESENIKDNTETDKDPRGTGRKLSIGNDVWIGANVFINASKVSSIGDGSIIGANSLVQEDVPPYSIVYGTPAKVQKYRFTEEQIAVLLQIKWWEWDKETLNRNIELLMKPELFFSNYS